MVGPLSAGSHSAALAALWLLHYLGPASDRVQHLMTTTLGVAPPPRRRHAAAKVLAFLGPAPVAELAARRANAANAAEPRHWSLPALAGGGHRRHRGHVHLGGGAGAIGVTVLLLVVFPHLPLPRIVAADIYACAR